MKEKDSGFFWPSFTDLMTSLFFIMLVLYVLTSIKLKAELIRSEKEKKATEEELKRIKNIDNAIKALPERYFRYDSIYKRFSLVENVEFDKGSDSIKTVSRQYLLDVGKSIKDLIEKLKTEKFSGGKTKYVVIIEGMSSDDGYIDNFPLSYKRAWAVLKLWTNNNLAFDQNVCEVQIAGSGSKGIGRLPKNSENLDDSKNQRILIQIIPKIDLSK
jgi:hypothetical protein